MESVVRAARDSTADTAHWADLSDTETIKMFSYVIVFCSTALHKQTEPASSSAAVPAPRTSSPRRSTVDFAQLAANPLVLKQVVLHHDSKN